MKKTLRCILLVLIILVNVFPIYEASAKMAYIENANFYENESDSIIDFVDENGESFLSSDIIAKENGREIELNDVKQLLNNYRVVVVYDLNNGEVYRNSCLMNNNAAVFYYDNDVFQSKYFQSSTVDEVLLKSEIIEFVNEKINSPKCQSQNDNVIDTTVFKALYQDSFRTMEKPYGYIDCDYTLWKNRVNDVSSLYILDAHMYFVPGQVALNNNETGFKGYENFSGFIHLGAKPAKNEVGYNQVRVGGTPVFKDAYPVNVPGVVAITSSYSLGTTLGYSFKNGFSGDGLTVSEDRDLGLNISFGYSKTYTNQEPALSAQKNASDITVFEWSYSYKSRRAETNHMKVGYVFEMNNRGHELLEGDVALTFDYSMTVKNWLAIKHTITGYQNHNWC